jgi:hypothetical protein
VVEILLVKVYRRNEDHRGATCICEKNKIGSLFYVALLETRAKNRYSENRWLPKQRNR